MLTDAQKATLKAAILADQTQVSNIQNLSYNLIANWLNAATTFIVWRSSVPVEEYREKVVWTEVDALLAGKARIWEWLTGQMTLSIEPYKINVRQGLADCWASNTTTRANLLALSKRAATRAESLLATGTGSDASPGTLGFEGEISVYDVGGIIA